MGRTELGRTESQQPGNHHAFALLIGVGAYGNLDAADLEGPVADVADWLTVARRLGIPDGHIRICITADLPSGIDVGGIDVRGATAADLRAGLKWLGEKVTRGEAPKGLLTWSGHGAVIDGETVFCPSDVALDAPGSALTVDEVSALLGDVADREDNPRLTAFIDVCHTPSALFAPLPGITPRALPGAEAPPQHHARGADLIEHPHHTIAGRVVTSSRMGTPSYEIPVPGGTRGALSWAAHHVLHRYGLMDGVRGTLTSRLTFGRLVGAIRRVLEGMQVPQQPCFAGRAARVDERVFSAFEDRRGDDDAQGLRRREIWPTAGDGKVLHFDLQKPDGTALGGLYITGSAAWGNWEPNRQYWSWNCGSWPADDFDAVYKGELLVQEAPAPKKAQVFAEGPLPRPSATPATEKVKVGETGRVYSFTPSEPGKAYLCIDEIGSMYTYDQACYSWSNVLDSDVTVCFTYEQPDTNKEFEIDKFRGKRGDSHVTTYGY